MSMIEYEPGGPIKAIFGINLTPKPLKLNDLLTVYFLVVFSASLFIGPSFRETSSKLTKASRVYCHHDYPGAKHLNTSHS